MTRLALPFALVALLAPSSDGAASRSRRSRNALLTVVEPHPGEPASAHPFVNVVVRFGRLRDATPADPTTFKARIGRDDVTAAFEPTFDAAGIQTGVRGRIEAGRVRLGRRPRNAMRFSVQAVRTGKGPRVRDVDRVRFAALAMPNRPCTARADADSQVIVPGIDVRFTASQASSDPDRDELAYAWDFGDGTTSTEPDPAHAYEVPAGDVTATLTVSDGQDTCTARVILEAVPPLDPGKTPGALFVESATALEMGAVAVGTSVARTLTLRNRDESGTSQVKLRLATSSGELSLSESAVTLGPGEARDVALTFAPQGTGHRHVRVGLVANASNRQAVSFLAHGFGGASPGAGPTLAADPVFFTESAPGLSGFGTYGYMPDGRRFFADNAINTCAVPPGALGGGDYCVDDGDCAANGGTCSRTSTCTGGTAAGQPCAVPADCPGGFCASFTLFDPVDMCSDGSSLFLISDDGTFTDPSPTPESDRSVTVMRMDYDAGGTVTRRAIIDRTTTETTRIACDGVPASQGGQVYVAEYNEVPDQGGCFRSEREALVRLAKSSGAQRVVTGRIDAYEGLGDCEDDLDPVQQLEATRDGSRLVAGFESGGLWQIRPAPIFYSADVGELFQVHPDGSVLVAGAIDSGATGFVNLYRITPDQVRSGPLPFAELVPCASLAVPNNGLRDAVGRTLVFGFAAARAAVGSRDATALVSFVAAPGPSPTIPPIFEVISPSLTVRGTVAFAAPADTTTCTVHDVVMLDAQEIVF